MQGTISAGTKRVLANPARNVFNVGSHSKKIYGAASRCQGGKGRPMTWLGTASVSAHLYPDLRASSLPHKSRFHTLLVDLRSIQGTISTGNGYSQTQRKGLLTLAKLPQTQWYGSGKLAPKIIIVVHVLFIAGALLCAPRLQLLCAYSRPGGKSGAAPSEARWGITVVWKTGSAQCFP